MKETTEGGQTEGGRKWQNDKRMFQRKTLVDKREWGEGALRRRR